MRVHEPLIWQGNSTVSNTRHQQGSIWTASLYKCLRALRLGHLLNALLCGPASLGACGLNTVICLMASLAGYEAAHCAGSLPNFAMSQGKVCLTSVSLHEEGNALV